MMRRRKLRDLIMIGAIFAAIYILLAYLALPAAWTHYEHQSALANLPAIARTAQGIPGDALNVGLIGSREDVLRAMNEAGFFPADPITFKSSLEIIGSVILKRPYRDAPVSNLYYDGRKEDLAFELPDGASADRRHHVRFWEVLKNGSEKQPVWLGSATFDASVGISRYTGQVTHHIAPDIDLERKFVVDRLVDNNLAEVIYHVTGVGPTLIGRNGEGDRYQTDGEIWIVTLVPAGEKQTKPPIVLASPPLVAMKDAVWNMLNNLFRN